MAHTPDAWPAPDTHGKRPRNQNRNLWDLALAPGRKRQNQTPLKTGAAYGRAAGALGGLNTPRTGNRHAAWKH
eukprot:2004406-Lingulodinium_polyedra.AAC.1